jgi:hypothetical protein
VRVHTVVISTQHDTSVLDKNDEFSKKAKQLIIENVIKPVIPKKLWNDEIIFHINPTGKFVVGGPHGDTGLTGRKIIVDSYGGRGAHGGGAFSGKDPSKVDRSACYMARYIAKNIVAAGLAENAEVQLAYAIGVANPVSVTVSTENTAVIPEDQIAELVKATFPLTPRGIIRHLDLLKPIYKETARHGHFGRIPGANGSFSWEKTDKAAALAKAAGLGARKADRLKAKGKRQMWQRVILRTFSFFLLRSYLRRLREEELPADAVYVAEEALRMRHAHGNDVVRPVQYTEFHSDLLAGREPPIADHAQPVRAEIERPGRADFVEGPPVAHAADGQRRVHGVPRVVAARDHLPNALCQLVHQIINGHHGVAVSPPECYSVCHTSTYRPLSTQGSVGRFMGQTGVIPLTS